MESKQGFGKYIREKRVALGLSQRALAERLFVTESAVSKWERGVSYPDITQITPLCEALGVSEHELVTASDDWRQRKLEQDAAAHRKVRLAWLVGIGVLYVVVVAGVSASAVAAGAFPGDVPMVLAACLFCFSFTHVPVLARSERGMCTFGAVYASLNLMLLAGVSRQGASGLADFGVAFVAVLFTCCLFALPAVLTWASRRFAPALGEHRALVCLGVDSALLLALVCAVCLNDGCTAARTAQMAAIAAVLLSVVWAVFLAVRYAPLAVPFRLALAFALFGLWVFSCGGLVNLVLGVSFDWHAAVNFADWTTYPTANDNLCWLALIVCLLVAGALCLVGVVRGARRRTALDREGDKKAN